MSPMSSAGAISVKSLTILQRQANVEALGEAREEREVAKTDRSETVEKVHEAALEQVAEQKAARDEMSIFVKIFTALLAIGGALVTGGIAAIAAGVGAAAAAATGAVVTAAATVAEVAFIGGMALAGAIVPGLLGSGIGRAFGGLAGMNNDDRANELQAERGRGEVAAEKLKEAAAEAREREGDAAAKNEEIAEFVAKARASRRKLERLVRDT